jgi:hypothetical protein
MLFPAAAEVRNKVQFKAAPAMIPWVIAIRIKCLAPLKRVNALLRIALPT